jgi:hypothetical protein
MTIFAFDKWRAAYFAADEVTRAIIRANTAMYDGLWDALYLLLLIGFSIGNTSLGLALVRAGRGVTRIVGFFLLAAVAITLPIITGEMQLWTMPEPLSSWSYPAIQPLGRTLIGCGCGLPRTKQSRCRLASVSDDHALATRHRSTPEY